MAMARWEEGAGTVAVRVLDGADPTQRYHRLAEQVLRLGGWLQGPQALALPQCQRDHCLQQYHALQDELFRLGGRLPSGLSVEGLAEDRPELLAA